MNKQPYAELKKVFPKTGTIEWIGLRNTNNKSIQEVTTAELLAKHGLSGDKSALKAGSKRQVTIIQAEHLTTIASFINRDYVSAAELRRNIVVSGINLSILNGHFICINEAIVQITGNCAPCQKMEQILGEGGYNAVRNHGGVTAKVEKGGVISIGDKVKVLTN